MANFFLKLFSADFMPHKMCFLEDATVLWLNVLSDCLIALAYYLIPFLLFYFIRRRRDVAFKWIFVAFGMFIFACGTTHVLSAVTVWNPVYRLEGLTKAVTAIASAAAFLIVWRMMPDLVSIPSPGQLAEVNRELAGEIAVRRAAEAEARQVNDELEERVARRTAELAQSGSRFRQLAEAMPQMVWIAGPQGADEYHNRQWSDYTGTSQSQPGGAGWNAILHPDDRQPAQDQWNLSLRTGDPFDAEFRLRGKDGSYRWFLGRGQPVFGESGGILRWFGTCTDIDDQKRATENLERALGEVRVEMKRRREVEDQLIHAQKMEAIGRLAGGVAHDFNNLLTVILGYSEMLREEVKENPAAREFADEVLQAGGRASALTGQLLAFGRRQVSVPRVLDLNDVVRHIDKMLRRIIGEDVELQIRLGSEIASVKVDPSQIDQVIMNLAVNSRDAMPHGGKLVIRTANANLTEEHSESHHGLQPGPYVVLSISDTGAGMDPLTKSRLFEPFFTTKETGKGTGLGLSIVYGIVKQHGGDILVSSEPGQGAAFEVYLPATSAEPEPLPAVEPAARAAPATGTILLVEDEDQVRGLTRTMLERLGYEVLDARCAADALELLPGHSGPVDLLLTDIVMPGMSGMDLARDLARVRPGVKVLFMSGYTGADVTIQGILSPDTPFIQKPFTAAELHNKVREALGRERA